MNARVDIALIERIAAELAPYREGDDAYFLDTLDSATDALDILDHEISAEQSDRALVTAIESQIADLKARAGRIGMRAESHRRVQKMIVQAMGVRKVERPLATLSLRAGGVSCVITDEASIPSQLCKTIVSPDKAAIKAQLEAGESVPGAELVRGADTLSVRVK